MSNLPRRGKRKRGRKLSQKTTGLSRGSKPWHRLDVTRHGLRIAGDGARPDLTNVTPEHPDIVVPWAFQNAVIRAQGSNLKGIKGFQPGNVLGADPAAVARAAKPRRKGGPGKQPLPGAASDAIGADAYRENVTKRLAHKRADLARKAARQVTPGLDDNDEDDQTRGEEFENDATEDDGVAYEDDGTDPDGDDGGAVDSSSQALVGAGGRPLGDLRRSKYLWKDLASAKKWLLDRIKEDFALTEDGDGAVTLMSVADLFAELTLMRRTMFLRMMESGGPFTQQGHTRAIMHTFIAIIDRELRAATALGLEKKQKVVNPIEGLKSAVAKATANQAEAEVAGKAVEVSGKAVEVDGEAVVDRVVTAYNSVGNYSAPGGRRRKKQTNKAAEEEP